MPMALVVDGGCVVEVIVVLRTYVSPSKLYMHMC